MEHLTESAEENESKKFSAYLERIGRPDLENKITKEKPWVFVTMEMYGHGNKGEGGLGILSSDILETAKKIGMPMSLYTLFYPHESKQVLADDFSQNIVVEQIDPASRGFKKFDKTVNVFTINNGVFTPTELEVWIKEDGSIKQVELTEPNLGRVYEDAKDSDHRLYQEIALGFGALKASKLLGERPSVIQLNESATVFRALAELDDFLRKEPDFERALAMVREKEIYTNHTLVQAAEAAFSRNQFERFVFPNIESEDLKKWLRGIINNFGGGLKLSTLTFALAGKKNGVSRVHAEEASKVYRDHERKEVEFEAVTNGISMERWGSEKILSLYREAGILDEFGLPATDYETNIDALDPAILKSIKKELR